MRLIAVLLSIAFAAAAQAQGCRVIDPELQASYSGPCVNGLAQGEGTAVGTAEYHGGFKAGRKHGKGVKVWPNGDRYEGGFVDDRRQGYGSYVFGRGPWAGERYDGEFVADRRQGRGVYRYATGDVYDGPWLEDVAIGPPTPMMQAQQKFRDEAKAAVARQGQKVCREMPVGIGGHDWVRGVVVALREDQVAIRLDDLGSGANAMAALAKPGEIVWDTPLSWTPCF